MTGGNRLLLFFAVNSLAQGMTGIVYEPLSYFLKDALGLDAGRAAAFVGWMTLPFLFKPLFGLLSDGLSLAGRLRRSHLAFSSALGAAGWLALALGPERPSYWPLLLLLAAINACTVFSDVVCDGLMVEASRAQGSSVGFQAVQIGTLYATLVVTGLGGGWLAAHASPRSIFALACGFSLLSFLSVVLAQERVKSDARQAGLKAFSSLLASRRFWVVSLTILLWNFTPLLGTAQFYFQSEHLKLGPVFIGALSTLSGVMGALGAFFFGRLGARGGVSGKVLCAGVWLGGPLHLLYLFYGGSFSAAWITCLLAFAGVIFRLALMDVAARSCPAGAEAAAFASYMSIFNFAAWSSNMAGGKVYAALSDPAAASALLCLLGAAATLLSWPLVSFIRKEIHSSHPEIAG